MVKSISGGAVAAICLLVATPFCGWLFTCGCSWPWSGLDSGCNINMPGNAPHCPWCASLPAGIAVLSLAALGGTLAAVLPAGPATMRDQSAAIAVRCLTGLTIFLLLATVGAGLAAAWQDYPLGIGRYVNGF